MGQNQDNLSQILRDIELGPVKAKLAAIGKLRFITGLPLESIQPALEKVLNQARDGSALHFFAAANLAIFGDSRDVVVDALIPYLQAGPFERSAGLDDLSSLPGEEIRVKFPWLGDCRRYFPPQMGMFAGWLEENTQYATVEALSHVRTRRAADALLRVLQAASWPTLVIYALGANGDPSARSTLEYYRDKDSRSDESRAARIALERFGNASLFDLAQLHREQQKYTCFIATAAYGEEDAPELELFRRFRDEFLLKRPIGRLSVSFYYSFSPQVAESIKESETARNLVRILALKPASWLISHAIRKNGVLHDDQISKES